MARNVPLIVIASLCGAAAGVVGSRLLPAPSPAPSVSAVAAPGVPASRMPAPDPQVAALQAQVRGVQARLATVDGREPPAPVPTEERGARERLAEAEHAAVIAQHAQEPRDAAWAGDEEQTLGTQLAALADKAALQLRGVDCRTHSCVARLAWADRDAARANLVALLENTAESGCARRIQFPEDGAAPYEAQLYLDCPRYTETR